MRTMRLILGDRGSGGLLAVIAAVCVCFQLAVTAFLCASTLPVSTDGTAMMVICHGSEGTAPTLASHHAGHGSQNEGANRASECPCAVLCMIGSAALPVAPGADLGFAYTLRGGFSWQFASLETPRPHSHPLGPSAQPRAPPRPTA